MGFLGPIALYLAVTTWTAETVDEPSIPVQSPPTLKRKTMEIRRIRCLAGPEKVCPLSLVDLKQGITQVTIGSQDKTLGHCLGVRLPAMTVRSVAMTKSLESSLTATVGIRDHLRLPQDTTTDSVRGTRGPNRIFAAGWVRGLHGIEYMARSDFSRLRSASWHRPKRTGRSQDAQDYCGEQTRTLDGTNEMPVRQ